MLLALLTTDADVEVASRAGATIAAIPTSALRRFLERDDVPEELRRWYAPYVAAVRRSSPTTRTRLPSDVLHLATVRRTPTTPMRRSTPTRR